MDVQADRDKQFKCLFDILGNVCDENQKDLFPLIYKLRDVKNLLPQLYLRLLKLCDAIEAVMYNIENGQEAIFESDAIRCIWRQLCLKYDIQENYPTPSKSFRELRKRVKYIMTVAFKLEKYVDEEERKNYRFVYRSNSDSEDDDNEATDEKLKTVKV